MVALLPLYDEGGNSWIELDFQTFSVGLGRWCNRATLQQLKSAALRLEAIYESNNTLTVGKTC